MYVTAQFGRPVLPKEGRDPSIIAAFRSPSWATANEAKIGAIIAQSVAREGHRVSVQKYQTGVPPLVPGKTTRDRILAALDTPKSTAEIAMALQMNKKTVSHAIRGLVWDGTVVPMGFRDRSQIWECTGDR